MIGTKASISGKITELQKILSPITHQKHYALLCSQTAHDSSKSYKKCTSTRLQKTYQIWTQMIKYISSLICPKTNGPPA